MGSAFAQKVGTAVAGAISPPNVLSQRDLLPTAQQSARATEAAAQATATRPIDDKRRTIQRPPRVEGNFANQETKDTKKKANASGVRAKQKHPDLGQEVDVTV